MNGLDNPVTQQLYRLALGEVFGYWPDGSPKAIYAARALRATPGNVIRFWRHSRFYHDSVSVMQELENYLRNEYLTPL